MDTRMQLSCYELCPREFLHNPSVPELYEESVTADRAVIAKSGALITSSGACTGRSPSDKRIVENPESQHNIHWGSANMPLRPLSYRMNRRRAIDYLNSQPKLYVIDGFAGWDSRYRIKVRLVCARPYHALFMKNMLIEPSPEELASFGQPDFVIFNAGAFPADTLTPDVTSPVSIDINFESQEIVLLGTQFAGEMKKAVFTVMNYLLPQKDVLSLHAAANEGPEGDVTLFLGLSGTGKTSLSADPNRRLIGDDEHGWSDDGIFNLEGGCYAKCIHLSPEKEPLIYDALRFGCVLENTVLVGKTREINFADATLTENTRASYPLQHLDNAKLPAIGNHPNNLIFLTCDAFGVLPPVSKLDEEQAIYHFLNGYTAKVSGTEIGVTEPLATFSPCYGAAFMTWAPDRYADLLARKLKEHRPDVWLVNTGWIAGDFEQGARIDIDYTRAIVTAIQSGKLRDAEFVEEACFGLQVPTQVEGVPSSILMPADAWPSQDDYLAAAQKLKKRFRQNYDRIEHESQRTKQIVSEYHRAVF